MSCFQKQLVIHKFALPLEILHIIKDFCFTLQTEKTRRAKSLLMRKIKNSSDTKYSVNASKRTTSILGMGLYGKLTTAFWKRREKLLKATILQRTMCNVCGNFYRRPEEKYSYPNYITYFRITCKCYRSIDANYFLEDIEVPFNALALSD